MSPRDARPTVSTVAKAAGVSPSLVSFVFNGRPGVAKATRDNILEVAERLGYTPDPRARELRTGKATTIGLIVRNVANPFFNEILIGMQECAESENVSIMAMDARFDPRVETDHVRSLAARRPTGLVLVPVGDAASAQLWQKLLPTTPLVIVNSRLDVAANVPHVSPDSTRAVRLAFDHLWMLGHRRIALLSAPPDLMPDGDRLNEYLTACSERAIQAMPLFASLTGDGLSAGLTEALSHNEAERPTAIITNSDYTAGYVYQAARERGWTIGRELSVVGHDDLATSELLAPGLTTIRVDLREIGRQAYARINNPDAGNYTAPVSLVVRGSTGAPTHTPC